jgi:hypothetical protein
VATAPALTPDTILHELAELWVTLGQQGQIESGSGVLRACSMTLVVVTEEPGGTQELGETLAALMPEHPARTIVLRLNAKARPALSSRVFAQCWMPFGQRRQICCEQIEITASTDAFEDALAMVDAVAAPDLPVVAWCRSFDLLERPEFRKLSAVATRVVVDSSGFPDPQAAVRLLADTAARGILLGDLSWTRLTRWREMFARAFEARQRPPAAEVLVEFGGPAPPVQGRYMAAWLIDSLRAGGASVTWTLNPLSSVPEGELGRVELTAAGLRIELSRTAARLCIDMDGLTRCANLPPATDYSLMREDLRIESSDPVFERALALAKTL